MSKVEKYFSDLRLRNKFLIAYSLLLIVPLMLIWSVFYNWFEAMAVEQTGKITSQTMKQAELHITYIRQEVENLGGLAFGNMDLQEILTEKETFMYRYVEEYEIITNIIQRMEENPKIHRVRIYVPDNKIYSHNNQNIIELSKLKDNPYYQLMLKKDQKAGWTECYKYVNSYGQNEKIVSYMMSIIDFNNLDQIIGFVSIDVLEKEFYTILKEIKIGDNGFAYMVNSDGGILSEAGSKPADAENILNNLPEDIKVKEGLNNFKREGKEYSFINTPIVSSDWKIIYIVPTLETNKQIRTSMNFTIVVMILCILVAFIIAVIVSSRITIGINELIGKMEKLEGIDTVASDNENIEYSKDEIGQLQHHFNQMMLRIQHLVKENYEVQLKQREARLKALQAQINPHFLYNVLDSINWMAIKVKAMNISEMVTDLGRFYRIGLSDGREIISIREELEHVKAYLKIQKARFEETLEVDFDVSEEILDYSIVKLALQPIVENAIVHGILAKPSQAGVIIICGRKEGNKILIQITDDGIGFDYHKVNYILSDPDSQFTKGFGIKNVNERIKLYFGQEYGMMIKRKEEKLTVVEITLPVRSDSYVKVCK